MTWTEINKKFCVYVKMEWNWLFKQLQVVSVKLSLTLLSSTVWRQIAKIAI